MSVNPLANHGVRQRVKLWLPGPLRQLACEALRRERVRKARARLGRGLEPLSTYWGSDRGQEIARYYLEQFLTEFAADIRGDCLEFLKDHYTTRLGGSAVEKLDILHIDHSNTAATIVADLTKPNDVPENRFSCIICTHVLHVVYDFKSLVQELHRILKPGGVLLVGVPQTSMYGPHEHELWRFTCEGLHSLLVNVFGTDHVQTRALGNSLTAAGEIRGLVADEFSKDELDYHDPRFAVEVCARAQKLS